MSEELTECNGGYLFFNLLALDKSFTKRQDTRYQAYSNDFFGKTLKLKIAISH